ncbi:hypothetical protein IEQ34_010157 [Dendrobium chrysotoxum]|uniref:glucan endo-1,3-beta-D-glucosidase n=1 Tax=Dendrobium chrysotoxum TaxID=161865 RepID=A0AAV7H124_DENCH|nr:hypothetical protein IEQ34_010157 [Dendrobium chrysotoxum]
MKRFQRSVTKIINKAIKKKKRRPPQPSPAPLPVALSLPLPLPLPLLPHQPSSSLAKMPSSHHRPYLFPQTNSPILPDPTTFFSPHLLSSPLPTNSFFQNFVLKNGDQPEYIHPYLIKSSSSSLSISFPSRFATSSFIYQTFVADLTISSPSSQSNHIISSFNDLSVTLDLPPSLRFFLVRGSPFITFSTLAAATDLSISSIHAFLSVVPNSSFTKHTFQLNSGQTFLCYSSSPIQFQQSGTTQLTAAGFAGVVRIAFLPDQSYETILDQYSSCYPVTGKAVFSRPGYLEYRWEKKGWGDLLLLAHPLHLRLLDSSGSSAADVMAQFKYRSIDGDLVGIVGDSWLLKTDPVSTTWYSTRGLSEDGLQEIATALTKDVNALDTSPIQTTSSYFYGKAIARAARLALIAEEVGFPDVIPTVLNLLRRSITPWLDGSFNGNGFLYDPKWGGLLTKQGSTDSGADFGFGIFNDHHYHLGYFLYAIAVLVKFDPSWGRKFKPQAYSIMADFMNLSGSNYARLRCFDLWKLHSWAGGLTEFADGRNQESTSEAVNAYYSAALMGLSYGDTHLVAIGSTIASFEIAAAETWWHVREGEGMYEEDFSRENRVVGVLWANKRDSGLWFAPAAWKECRLGIQVLPLLPITEDLFRDVGFVKDLVNWTLPALTREGVTDGWKGFVYAMEGVYDKEDALGKIRSLNGHDDGNSLSNLLWWVYSRAEENEGGVRGGWFGHYCH